MWRRCMKNMGGGMRGPITYQNDVGSNPHGLAALVLSVSLVLGPLRLCMCVVDLRN